MIAAYVSNAPATATPPYGPLPLAVSFGSETFRAGVELSIDEFWERVLAPAAPFPTVKKLYTIDDVGGWDTVNTSLFDKEKGLVLESETPAVTLNGTRPV